MRLLCWLLCSLLAGSALAAPAVAEIPFEFRDGLLRLEVTADNSGETLNFLLDSGASVSVLNLPTAVRLGVKPGNRVKVQGVRKNSSGYWPAHLNAHAAGLPLPDRYLVTDLSELSKACNFPVDGLIGADFFQSRIVQIDFSARRIRLPQRNEISSSDCLPLRFKNGRLQVPVSVNDGASKWVRVDTGCTSSLQWVSGAANKNPLFVTRSVGLSKCAFPTTTAQVRLGGRVFADVDVGIHARPIFPGEFGLLGTGILGQFQTVTFDLKAARLVLD